MDRLPHGLELMDRLPLPAREPQMKGKSVSSRVPWKLSPVTTNCCITVNRLEAVIQTILQRRFQANREQGLGRVMGDGEERALLAVRLQQTVHHGLVAKE